jgi:hypothetical protein
LKYEIFSNSNEKNKKLREQKRKITFEKYGLLKTYISGFRSSPHTQRNAFARGKSCAVVVKGGTVAGALAAINATLTRVNGVFEKDFSLHLILQDFPQLIFTNPATDPYTTMSNWNSQLQTTLTNTIGDAAYDIGHMFGASGGGGNAGCIGCVCLSGKGSGITSPADAIPEGDNFDIDYVAHEMGHQVGGNHTFSMSLETGTGTNVEPGSGSTIMGYAGITGGTDVQPHSDALFHISSIAQVQNNLTSKTCDIETPIANNPPVIAALPSVTIPKNTPFVLTAEATDAEGDPITYIWEQADNATTSTTKANAGTLTNGPNFRSYTPTTDPSRFFPKLSTVLSGVLKNTITPEWEAVSTVARTMNFKVTVRDNNADVAQQQTTTAIQTVTVSNNGPFQITTTKVYNNAPGPLTWDVVGTNAAPFNVANVKVDYSADNGNTWIVLAASTPNDGSEDFSFASFAAGTQLYVRISAIGNVFYTLGKVIVSQIVPCDGSAPVGLGASNITQTSVKLSWDPIASAVYTLKYRQVGNTNWTDVPTSTNSADIASLEEGLQYECQVASICSGTTGTYSASVFFTTALLDYCGLTSTNSNDEYISNVTVTPQAGIAAMTNSSGAGNYTDYSSDPARLITLLKGSTGNTISVSKAWTGTKFSEAITVWIDFNRNGIFEASELIMQTAANQTTPVSTTFSVPSNAYDGDKVLKMRVVLRFSTAQTDPCGSYTYGEVEDYAVKIVSTLAVSETGSKDAIQVYPNPATDVLNISKVSSKATYSIYNISGQLSGKGKITDNKVNISNLPKGVYMISVEDNGAANTIKFIKN